MVTSIIYNLLSHKHITREEIIHEVAYTYVYSYIFIRIGQEILMEDNLPDDEIEIELSPIAVQLAYVQQVKVLTFSKSLSLFHANITS